MNDFVAVIYLPPDKATVGLQEAIDLLTNVLHPHSVDESYIADMKRLLCREHLDGSLRTAVRTGSITPRSRISNVPVPEWEGAQLLHAVMTRSDFERFAATVLVRVDSDAALGVADQAGVAASSIRAIPRKTIMQCFVVGRTEADNEAFWERKLSDPPAWLIGARLDKGGPGVSAEWDPLAVAACLLERRLMTLRRLDEVVRTHFFDRYDEWRERTEDQRET